VRQTGAVDRIRRLAVHVGWLRDLRNRFEATNNRRNQWVLGYNPQRLREVLSRLGLTDPDWRSMSVALATLCAIAFTIVGIATLHQRPRATALGSALLRGRQPLRATARTEGLHTALAVIMEKTR